MIDNTAGAEEPQSGTSRGRALHQLLPVSALVSTGAMPAQSEGVPGVVRTRSPRARVLGGEPAGPGVNEADETNVTDETKASIAKWVAEELGTKANDRVQKHFKKQALDLLTRVAALQRAMQRHEATTSELNALREKKLPPKWKPPGVTFETPLLDTIVMDETSILIQFDGLMTARECKLAAWITYSHAVKAIDEKTV